MSRLPPRLLPALVLAAALAALILDGGGRPPLARATPAQPAESLSCAPTMGPGPVLPQPPLSPAVQSALTAIANQVEAARLSRSVAGLAVGIVFDQSVIFAQGFGCASLSPPTEATAQTVFEMASITKTFTATMLMQLRDAGRLQLDDPVNRYVPEAVYLAPDGSTVSPTFRELAAHTSGLPRDMRPVPRTVAELFQRLPSIQAQSEPGSEYFYSNLGYAVLGQVLAQIAGQSYDDYVTANILVPLGMAGSGFDPAPLRAQLATGYRSVQVTPSGVMAVAARLVDPQGAYNPAGGLLSSAADMVRFLMLQFRDGPVGGDQILSAASLAEMWQPVAPTEGTASSTIGWFVNEFGGQTIVCKNGGLPGFNTQMCALPQAKLGVVLLGNTAPQQTGPANLNVLAHRILAALAAAMSAPASASP
jgi:CubicO group peptidase (beta-lactamase class C family)